jgi:hypothetical protein
MFCGKKYFFYGYHMSIKNNFNQKKDNKQNYIKHTIVLFFLLLSRVNYLILTVT